MKGEEDQSPGKDDENEENAFEPPREKRSPQVEEEDAVQVKRQQLEGGIFDKGEG